MRPREGPIEAIIGRVAAFDRMIQRGKIRHDGFVGDRWIIECEHADEEPIARYAVRMCRMRGSKQRKSQYGVAYCPLPHRSPPAFEHSLSNLLLSRKEIGCLYESQ